MHLLMKSVLVAAKITQEKHLRVWRKYMVYRKVKKNKHDKACGMAVLSVKRLEVPGCSHFIFVFTRLKVHVGTCRTPLS